MLGQIERRLGEESNIAVSLLTPVPEMSDANFDSLESDLNTAKGDIQLVETTSAGMGLGRGAAPQQDWQPKRFGPTIPPGNAELRRDAAQGIVACLAIPPALWVIGDGAALRESYRQFLHTTLAPIGIMVAAELTAKLNQPVALDFGRLAAADVASRARAAASLAAAGVDLDTALEMAGLG